MASDLDDLVGVDTIQLHSRVYATRSALYGKNKRAVREMSEAVDQALMKLRKFMKLPKNLRVLLRPLRGNTYGQFTMSQQLIEMDVTRANWRQFYTDLCHECVHAEQYATGIYDLEYNRNKGRWMFRWGNDYHAVDAAVNVSADYDAYLSQPWEMEAFRRENELATKLMGILRKKDGPIVK